MQLSDPLYFHFGVGVILHCSYRYMYIEGTRAREMLLMVKLPILLVEVMP
jgi:hypothetical protein